MYYNILFVDPTSLPRKRKSRIKLKLNKLRGKKRKRKSSLSSAEESEGKYDQFESGAVITKNEWTMFLGNNFYIQCGPIRINTWISLLFLEI